MSSVLFASGDKLCQLPQSTGVGELNRAIVQLESVTQQNAALVEQAAARRTWTRVAALLPQLVDVARTRGRGWVNYRRPNRRAGRIEATTSYVERVGKYLVGCGTYRAESATQKGGAPPGLAAPRLFA